MPDANKPPANIAEVSITTVKGETLKSVGVLDIRKSPQTPVQPAAARRLLSDGQAAIYRKHPFTIILKTSADTPPEKLRLKVDPGSRTTGLAIVNDSRREIVWAGEIKHRGPEIKKALDGRRAVRRGRRNRHTRYRPTRFNNRRRPDGWLPPSLMSRVHNVETWVKRLCASFSIGAISVEVARFDTQLMENPDISGVEYQQGTLAGYEVREYLLEKFQRKCAYCGKTDVPVEIEHIIPKSRGGSDGISNLALACHTCNQKKGNRTAAEFGHPQVAAQARRPLRDAAMMNATRYAVRDMLKVFGLPVETGTGGRTKWNRTVAGLEKSHWADAACVGESTPDQWHFAKGQVQEVRAHSYARRGRRQACLVNKSGFPRTGGKVGVRSFGYQTGDVVRAVKVEGKWAGVYQGRISVRKSGVFVFSPRDKEKQPPSFQAKDIVKLLDRCGSYEYSAREMSA